MRLSRLANSSDASCRTLRLRSCHRAAFKAEHDMIVLGRENSNACRIELYF